MNGPREHAELTRALASTHVTRTTSSPSTSKNLPHHVVSSSNSTLVVNSATAWQQRRGQQSSSASRSAVAPHLFLSSPSTENMTSSAGPSSVKKNKPQMFMSGEKRHNQEEEEDDIHQHGGNIIDCTLRKYQRGLPSRWMDDLFHDDCAPPPGDGEAVAEMKCRCSGSSWYTSSVGTSVPGGATNKSLAIELAEDGRGKKKKEESSSPHQSYAPSTAFLQVYYNTDSTSTRNDDDDHDDDHQQQQQKKNNSTGSGGDDTVVISSSRSLCCIGTPNEEHVSVAKQRALQQSLSPSRLLSPIRIQRVLEDPSSPATYFGMYPHPHHTTTDTDMANDQQLRGNENRTKTSSAFSPNSLNVNGANANDGDDAEAGYFVGQHNKEQRKTPSSNSTVSSSSGVCTKAKLMSAAPYLNWIKSTQHNGKRANTTTAMKKKKKKTIGSRLAPMRGSSYPNDEYDSENLVIDDHDDDGENNNNSIIISGVCDGRAMTGDPYEVFTLLQALTDGAKRARAAADDMLLMTTMMVSSSSASNNNNTDGVVATSSNSSQHQQQYAPMMMMKAMSSTGATTHHQNNNYIHTLDFTGTKLGPQQSAHYVPVYRADGTLYNKTTIASTSSFPNKYSNGPNMAIEVINPTPPP